MKKIFKTMDGNAAASYVAYAMSEVSTIFPITPSTSLGEAVDIMASQGKKNVFGNVLEVREMQSEAGAAGAMHGALLGGALATTFTASQGLLLMIPTMYKMAAELLPGVFHVPARAIAAQALSIFGDHQDVMAIRQTGVALLASSSVQEAFDMALIAHLSAVQGSLPFCHFFDGFRTSHEINKIEILDYDTMGSLVDYDAVARFKERALNPQNPVAYGSAQNSDIYFQGRERSNEFYNMLPYVVLENMKRFEKLTGRSYRLFDYYGAPEATRVIIAMGSACETIEETVDTLNARGENVGAVKVHLYRPFHAEALLEVIPASAEVITVLDRTKESGSLGEPLYLDVVASFAEAQLSPRIIGGRYGLAGKEFTPKEVAAIYANMDSMRPKNHFTVGITDDITYTSLDLSKQAEIEVESEGLVQCKLIGIGSDGTVGANKQAIKIVGDNTDLYAQGYFYYDSKKAGGFTVSHLRFGKNKIRSSYLVHHADYVACHKPSYVNQYDVLDGIKQNGIFVLNTPWTTVEQLEKELPVSMRRIIGQKQVKFYVIDAVKIASSLGLGSRINMIMQTVFFKLTEVLPIDEAVELLKKSVRDAYGKKGEEVVSMNIKAIDASLANLMEVTYPDTWKDLQGEDDAQDCCVSVGCGDCGCDGERPEYITNYVDTINKQKGDTLPVSAMSIDGSLPLGTAAYEKRKVAVMIPEWIMDNCIQCNQCALICPHATIRPFLATDEQLENKPDTFATLNAVGKGMENLHYRIQVYPEDCLGCSVCVDVCPGKKGEKALVMKPIDDIFDVEKANLSFAQHTLEYLTPEKRETVKGSQFYQPLLEFSGACAGCGETPYVKLLTQLFGEDMIIANATGCSSIWGASAPSMPYTTNSNGQGPAWANSLFEDNAEFGYGIMLAYLYKRQCLIKNVEALLAMNPAQEIKTFFEGWLQDRNDREKSKEYAETIYDVIGHAEEEHYSLIHAILEDVDVLRKRVIWLIGGDGWAYDIGYGGLDHVLAMGEDINVLVLDTEVYSNTGGQSSKSTPLSAIAKFAARGKRTFKKDLGRISMCYGYIYVASTSLMSKPVQAIKAFTEAVEYNGPSIVLAYAPCIEHGIRKGLAQMAEEEKMVVDAGYWPLYRYDPRKRDAGESPLTIEYKGVDEEKVRAILEKENRFNRLHALAPEEVEILHKELVKELRFNYNQLQAIANAEIVK